MFLYSYYYAVRTRSTAYMNSLEQIFVKNGKSWNSWCWWLRYLRNDNNYRGRGLHCLVAWLFPLATVKTKLEYLLPFREIFDRKQEPWTRCSFTLFLAVRIHSYGCWIRNVVQVSIPNSWCWRLYISEKITTTETWFVPFGSVTLALGHSENETRISFTVSEIFDAKDNNLTRYFFIMPYELVRRHIWIRSSKFSSKWKILDVGDYNISETIRTTETWVAPFGSVTLPLGHSKNETQISLTVRRYSTGSKSPEGDISLFSLLLAVRIHSYGCWFRLLEQVSIPKFWCWRLHISETMWKTETSFAPFGSATIALGHRENRTWISPTVSEIFDRKTAQNADITLFFFFFFLSAEACSRISSYRNGPILEISTSYQS